MQILRDSLTKINFIVLAILILVAVGTTFWSAGINATTSDEWKESILQNFSTEMMGALITFALFELIVGTQQRSQDSKAAKTQRKQDAETLERLQETITSTVTLEIKRTQKVSAVARLKQVKGTSEDRQPILDEMIELDYLEGIDLYDVDLESAMLLYANLKGATLHDCKLTNAYLENADLQGTDLINVSLDRATLEKANLQGASLLRVDFRGTNLRNVNLQGTYVELHEENFWGATFNTDTILPDGKNWTPNTDMESFTNPTHPDFWRPKPDVNSWLPRWYKPDKDNN